MIRKRYLVGIPFLVLVALLLPLAVLLAPLALVACLAARVDPVEAFRSGWRVLAALRGAYVQVTEADRLIEIHIS